MSKVRSSFKWAAALGIALTVYMHFNAGCASAMNIPRSDGWGAIAIAAPSVAIVMLLIASSPKTSKLVAILIFLTLPFTSFWGASFIMGFPEEMGQRYCNP